MTEDYKVYVGIRTADAGPGEVTVHQGGKAYPLVHHVKHSPDGFQWGYGGSGPSELAKDILWDLYGKEPHPTFYQAFKEAFIAGAEGDRITITEVGIRAWAKGRTWAKGSNPPQFETDDETADFLRPVDSAPRSPFPAEMYELRQKLAKCLAGKHDDSRGHHAMLRMLEDEKETLLKVANWAERMALKPSDENAYELFWKALNEYKKNYEVTDEEPHIDPYG